VAVTIVSGPVVSEAQQVFCGWVAQTVRVWAGGADAVDFEWTVGPIPFSDGLGREVIAQYAVSDWAGTPGTNGTWYTDSNGRDSMTRIHNFRPSFNFTPVEPVASNYYPVNTFTYMQVSEWEQRLRCHVGLVGRARVAARSPHAHAHNPSSST